MKRIASIWLCATAMVMGAAPVVLPIEVVGSAGTTASATIDVPRGGAARLVWMQIHNLEYSGMASVRVNDGAWLPLSNTTSAVAEPGRSYGGIGGGFATLKLTIPVQPLHDGANTIQFRFNQSNGVASGFRVLGFQFLDEAGCTLIPARAFVQDDSSAWQAPRPQDFEKGRALWTGARLTGSGAPIRAHCGDCHSRDGRDLKYFNYSNASIIARAEFHSLSNAEGQQIASYIRGLPGPSPGRPWNPPYQPGPGLDQTNWAAGAGLAWVLDDDAQTLERLTPGAFRPDTDLNVREIPIAMQLPDWNHWLPRVHPLDFRGSQFEGSAFAKSYGGGPPSFERWLKARRQFLMPPHSWTPELGEAYYSAQLWQLVKTWETVQEYGLEAGHSWPNTIPAAAAPEAAGIPDGPNGMGGSALNNQYFNNAWYELQALLNSGEHRHRGRGQVDWVYLIRSVLVLEHLSGRTEPGRLLTIAIKSLQSTDPSIGPANLEEGWRPERNIDPRLILSCTFEALPHEARRRLAEAMVHAWLEKNEQYTPASYFGRGRSAKQYEAPRELRDIYGGRVWEALPGFRALGVSPILIQRLETWGKAYTAMAELFHY